MTGARPDEQNVFADGIELLAVPGAESLAQADQQKKRPDAPSDAKHGQKRAQFMRPERLQRLAEDVEDKPQPYIISTEVEVERRQFEPMRHDPHFSTLASAP